MTATQTLGSCSLYIDMQPDDPAPIPGDWITTEAGSRYLVTASRRVERRRRHAQNVRWALRCDRLPRGIDVPPDVRAIGLRWYSRGRS